MDKLLVEVNNLIDVVKKSTTYRNIAPTIKDFYFYDAIIIIIEGDRKFTLYYASEWYTAFLLLLLFKRFVSSEL